MDCRPGVTMPADIYIVFLLSIESRRSDRRPYQRDAAQERVRRSIGGGGDQASFPPGRLTPCKDLPRALAGLGYDDIGDRKSSRRTRIVRSDLDVGNRPHKYVCRVRISRRVIKRK